MLLRRRCIAGSKFAEMPERRAGELLQQMAKEGGRQKRGGDRKSKSTNTSLIPSLSDLNISPDQSSKWQLANVPKEQFEAALAEPEPATTIGIIRAVNGSPRVDDDSLWLWGRLRDFERGSVLRRSQADHRAHTRLPETARARWQGSSLPGLLIRRQGTARVSGYSRLDRLPLRRLEGVVSLPPLRRKSSQALPGRRALRVSPLSPTRVSQPIGRSVRRISSPHRKNQAKAGRRG
jgi:hypothetical protein